MVGVKNNKTMKPVIKVIISKEDSGYSAFAKPGNYSIHTEGDSFEQLKENILDAVNFTFEPDGFVYAINEIQFSYDLESFFEFYKIVNAKALASRIGMNQSLLSQYIKGKKTPSSKQANRILQGVKQIGRELSEVEFHV